MFIEPASLGLIIGGVGAAVSGGIIGVLRLTKRNGHSQKACPDHSAVCARLAFGEEQFEQINEKLDAQREMIHSTHLDIKEMSTIVKMMHKDSA